jgi:hypothetical protein
MRVTGKSLIDHNKRSKLELTCDEYAVLDYIVNKIHLSKDGTFELSEEDFVSFFGEYIFDEIQSLCEKKLIALDENTVTLGDTTKKIFGESIDSLFNQIWALGNRGNKQQARTNFVKAIKADTFENLLASYKYHIATTEETYRISTYKFFDVKNKLWEDYLKQAQQPKQEAQSVLTPISHDYK